MALYRAIWAVLEPVPRLLRILAVASIVVGVAVAVETIVPGGSIGLNGVELSHHKMWETRVAVAMLITAPLMLATGIAILRRARAVRFVLVIMPILQFLPFQVDHWVFGAPDPVVSTLFYVVACGGWAIFAIVYLFFYRTPRDYFR
jgi:hypothetical protein